MTIPKNTLVGLLTIGLYVVGYGVTMLAFCYRDLGSGSAVGACWSELGALGLAWPIFLTLRIAAMPWALAAVIGAAVVALVVIRKPFWRQPKP